MKVCVVGITDFGLYRLPFWVEVPMLILLTVCFVLVWVRRRRSIEDIDYVAVERWFSLMGCKDE